MNAWDEARGYGIAEGVVGPMELPAFVEEAERLFAEDGRRPAGVRGVLGRSRVFSELAGSEPVRRLVSQAVGGEAFVARSILFDKCPEANWDVPWHQDTTIAVVERSETAGFGPWSVKEGVPHVRPPAAVLERMITVRLHLDPCTEHSGPLLVVPGSHRSGIMSGLPQFAELEAAKVACPAPAGGAVIMRPLILHASRKATSQGHRRVLHLEFAAEELPGGLRWARY